MKSLDGAAGLLTGAAGGIGRACALRLAAEGANLVLTDLPSQKEAGEETARRASELGVEAVFVAGDVTSSGDQSMLVDGVVERFGRLDLAVNNAGVEHQASLIDMTEADFDRVIDINLKGVWLGLKWQLAQMRRQGGGAIVNISSLAGLVSPPLLGAYVASKHGVIGLTKTAAVENADLPIRVNAVCPASIRTPLMDVLAPEQLEQWVSRMAIKRLGEADEVAAAVCWLLSPAASFVTGAAVPVDAGASAK